MSLPGYKQGKLSQRFYGPYKILERIGSVSYKLELPEGSRLHDVFHVSLLKKFHGEVPAEAPPLPAIKDGRVIPSPVKVLRSSVRRGVQHLLVQWAGSSEMDATWEPLADFVKHYPEFQLEDELLVEEGRDIMWGIPYRRRVKPYKS